MRELKSRRDRERRGKLVKKYDRSTFKNKFEVRTKKKDQCDEDEEANGTVPKLLVRDEESEGSIVPPSSSSSESSETEIESEEQKDKVEEDFDFDADFFYQK